jgi:hypothetical protein
VDYFYAIFNSSNPVIDESFLNLLYPIITDEENEILYSILDETKIFHAISLLGPNKVHDPDSMNDRPVLQNLLADCEEGCD